VAIKNCVRCNFVGDFNEFFWSQVISDFGKHGQVEKIVRVALRQTHYRKMDVRERVTSLFGPLNREFRNIDGQQSRADRG
jgi:hypothetical protein